MRQCGASAACLEIRTESYSLLSASWLPGLSPSCKASLSRNHSERQSPHHVHSLLPGPCEAAFDSQVSGIWCLGHANTKLKE